MPARRHRPVAAALAALFLSTTLAAPPARAGKLDLDVYSGHLSDKRPPSPSGAPSWLHGVDDLVAPRPVLPGRAGSRRGSGDQWRPGDPRDLHGQPVWVQYVSHAGYTGLGIAGVVASLATGGVAPAVGFGIVTAVQAYRGWRLHREVASRPSAPPAKG